MEGSGRASATIGNDAFPSRELDASPNLPGQRATRTREVDCEMGLGNNGTFPQSMVSLYRCRRFGYLQSRVLLYNQQEFGDLEQRLHEEPDSRDNGYQSPSFDRRYAPENLARRKLVRAVKNELSEYSSKILSMQSLRWMSKPSIDRDQSVREWVLYGPSINLNRSELENFHWDKYDRAVTKLLNDPTHSDWLDKPGFANQALKDSEKDEGENLKRVRENIILALGIVFWISHISAPIAYFLILSSLESNDKSFTVILCRLLLGYWYASATVIVVIEILAKGQVYIRKIVLGGCATCVVGFYVLNVLLHIPATFAVNGLYTLITLVLVFIKFM